MEGLRPMSARVQGMWRGFEQINVIRKDERDSGELMEKE
jgi:hypothetical protein